MLSIEKNHIDKNDTESNDNIESKVESDLNILQIDTDNSFVVGIVNKDCCSPEEKPTICVNTLSISVLPKNVDWADIEGFVRHKYGPFNIHYVDKNNNRVVSFTFFIAYSCKGSYQGAGKYLSNVTMVPKSIKVSCGYHFSCNVTALEPENFGTKIQPIAGITLEVKWKVESSHSFFIEDDYSLLEENNQNYSTLIESSMEFLVRGDCQISII